ncbi:MAG: hypothetical protein IPH20_21280 [Bacteroidales bacterium]|nr:hypothetical protein [Bacteroidales bacterium]
MKLVSDQGLILDLNPTIVVTDRSRNTVRWSNMIISTMVSGPLDKSAGTLNLLSSVTSLLGLVDEDVTRR